MAAPATPAQKIEAQQSAFDQFQGAKRYLADDYLMADVNSAIALGRPLLVRGEPGTGKTMLAHAVAESLGKPLHAWYIKSTTQAREGLYHYDVVQRLNDSRFGDADVSDIRRYIRPGVLGRAFAAPEQVVLLIDEIDKADIEFPNDLLRELDEMAFDIPELDETVRAVHRPITIITSNAEKELPYAFLRRCVFHYIAFPQRERIRRIVAAHLPDLENTLVESAVSRFYDLRRVAGLRKKPSTSELLDWLMVLARAGVSPEQIARRMPFMGVLVKQEQDLELLASKKGWEA
ncbi:MAG: MoxR family ATPase [Oligoflexia bacterium]|nr:MoxR family ATPase [Oligoflexia bacterium]